MENKVLRMRCMGEGERIKFEWNLLVRPSFSIGFYDRLSEVLAFHIAVRENHSIC